MWLILSKSKLTIAGFDVHFRCKQHVHVQIIQELNLLVHSRERRTIDWLLARELHRLTCKIDRVKLKKYTKVAEMCV